MIPFVDLNAQYLSIQGEIDLAIKSVLQDKKFILGPHVEEFEKVFAGLQRTKHCVACSNGTSAIFLALKALGIKEGDEVITVPNTFIATTEMISKVGAKVIFVDVDGKTKLMNPDLLESVITEKTKAIIPVHLHGQMCNMPAIKKIADKHNLFIVEDAAQAHCAEFDGARAGFYSAAATFSFYPGKNLGAYGDAGAVVTNDLSLAKKISQLRNHGRVEGEKYIHEIEAYSERMDGLQAAVLLVKLKYIENWNSLRRKNAELYDELLLDVKDIFVPSTHSKALSVFHIYAIKLKDKNKRDALLSFLRNKNISVGVHYPIPLHLQPAYVYLDYKKGDFPVSELLAEEIVSLPMFPELNSDQINFVCSSIKQFFEQ